MDAITCEELHHFIANHIAGCSQCQGDIASLWVRFPILGMLINKKQLEETLKGLQRGKDYESGKGKDRV